MPAGSTVPLSAALSAVSRAAVPTGSVLLPLAGSLPLAAPGLVAWSVSALLRGSHTTSHPSPSFQEERLHRPELASWQAPGLVHTPDYLVEVWGASGLPQLVRDCTKFVAPPPHWPPRRSSFTTLPSQQQPWSHVSAHCFSFASLPALRSSRIGVVPAAVRGQPSLPNSQQHGATCFSPCSAVPSSCRKGASGACLQHRRDQEVIVDAEELLCSLKECLNVGSTPAGEKEETGVEVEGRAAIRDSLEPSEPLLWHPRRDPGRLPSHVTFYKRELPAPSIAFSSPEGKRLWTEALLDGNADCYFKLSEQFITQAEPAYCGLTSLAMVLNTLSIDPRRTWKGVWRWYVEDMVNCCTNLENVQENGVTFQQVANLAQCNGAEVEVVPYDGLSLERFRELILHMCRQDEKFLIVSYSRAVLNQTGDGHFSPVGGYNAKSDRVLILDVARFKYPPHWVPLSELYKAMSFLDPETGKPRGAMVLSRSPHPSSVLFMLDVISPAWKELGAFLSRELPSRAAAAVSSQTQSGAGACSTAFNLAERLASAVANLPPAVTDSITTRIEPECNVSESDSSCSHHQASLQLLTELRALPLYKAMVEKTGTCKGLLAERLVLLLLMAPHSTWDGIPTKYRRAVVEMLNPSSGRWALTVIASEVEFLRLQLNELRETDRNNSSEERVPYSLSSSLRTTNHGCITCLWHNRS